MLKYIKLVKEYFGLISLIGFISAILFHVFYYKQFNIKILSYISPLEAITLVVDNLFATIIAFGLILVFIYFQLINKFVQINNKSLDSFILIIFLNILASSIYIINWYFSSASNIKILNKISYHVFLTCIIILIMSIIYLYDLLVIRQKRSEIIDKNKTDNIIHVMTYINYVPKILMNIMACQAAIILIFSISIYSNAIRTMTESSKNDTTIYFKDSTYVLDKKEFIIGRTNDYMFIYNDAYNSSTILKNNNIEKIVIKSK